MSIDPLTQIAEALDHIRVRLLKLETQETPIPPTVVYDSARASGNLVLTTSTVDIPGCTLTLEPGEYIITGIFDVDGGTDADQDAFAYFFGILDVAGVDALGQAHANLAWQDTRGAPTFVKGLWTVAQQWHVTLAVQSICKLQANKGGVFASGNSQINANNTVITAIGTLA